MLAPKAQPAAGRPPVLILAAAEAAQVSERVFIDARNLKCPGPIVKVADYLRDKPDVTRIRVEATEDAFYSVIRIWCERTGNQLDSLSSENGVIHDPTDGTAEADCAAGG